MGRNVRAAIEVVATGDPTVEAVAILRHYLAKAKRGELIGLMVIAELPLGGYDVQMTSTNNVAERLGRIDILHDAVLDRAEGE